MPKRRTPSLPAGTVTLLFTDIEGSASLLQQLGDRYAEVLAHYWRFVRSAIQDRGGQEVDTQGDALFAAFSRARDAVAAGIAAQRAIGAHAWPEDLSLRVRMGLHTGETLSGETGYAGMDVHRAARICAAGHGGQILLSQATRDLVVDVLPNDVSLRDLGEHRLKDLAHAYRLFQVVVADLPADFPPLKSLDVLPNNLPRQLTSFIGREREMAEVKRLLSEAYLVTLTGIGGSGKTRLALQIAAEVVDRYLDGAWCVQFASLSEALLVPQAVASALGIREQRGRSLMDVLLDNLRHKGLLLVLDNVEHLVSACASLADTLLRGCAGLRILVTSREPLRIEGEHIYPVPPLSLPSPGTLLPASTLAHSEAIQLFVDRAVSAHPSFVLTEQNATAILQICRRLDGIPLALELAAAQVRTLSVERIVTRLDDQFRLLTDGRRTALPRHQTLRATMDWSYELLTEPERLLYRRLAIFGGTFSLDAAEAVCSGRDLAESAIIDLLAHLVEKSLIVAGQGAGEVRYHLLEPARQYALGKLQETAEASDVGARHRDYFLALAEQGHLGLASAERMSWQARIESDHDNIRTALRWSIDHHALEEATRLGASMARFWASRGLLNEGMAWLAELRKHEDQVSPRTRAGLLSGAGLVAFEIGEQRAAAEVTDHALAIFQQLGDRPGIEVCLRLLGLAELEIGNYERAAALLDEAAKLPRGRGDGEAEAEALRQRGYLAVKQGDYALATETLERSLAAVRQTGKQRSIGFAIGHLAQAYFYQGQSDRAIAMLMEALDRLRAVEHGTGTAYFLNLLGLALLQKGDRQGSAKAYRSCLSLAGETGYRWAIAQGLMGIGALSTSKGEPALGTRLLAAAEALLTKIDYVIPSSERIYMERLADSLRRSMPPDEFEKASSQGRRMSMEQAVESAQLALSDAEDAPDSLPTRHAPAGNSNRSTLLAIRRKKWSPALSRREQEVAVLVAQGCTNREIAETLAIAEKTANAHVQNIFNKLGFNSRAQIAAWVATQSFESPNLE
jgi:predicted ATPase/class 3 adenylate cyclase/DNA-binding NarL/FixJ family response regulator